MTSKGFTYPTRIQNTFQGKKGLISLDQMRAVDKSRLIQKIGVISKNAQIKAIACLQEVLAFILSTQNPIFRPQMLEK